MRNFMALSFRNAWVSPGAVVGLVLWLAATGAAWGQAPLDSLGGLVRKLSHFDRRGPHEKLFLHLDRPVYLSGETMWFKVYAVDGTYARPLALSSAAYVEVLNTANQPVLQGKVALRHATGQGTFVLPTSLAAGSYTVRAYTSWMKNFGPEAYFHATIRVINTFVASGASAKDSATADVQFFPEGGNLVAGLSSKIAFKATDKSGQGIAAEGKVLNQAGAVVATFRTLCKGMGTFVLAPAAAAGAYTAVVKLGNNQSLSRPLPRVYEQGYVLRLEPTGPDQLTLTVSATTAQPEMVYLLAHSRQKIGFAARAQLVGGKATFVVSQAQLLDGVSHFTLFNGEQQPVCERLYFRAPPQRLALAVRADKPQYTTRDRVRVEVTASDGPAPVAANVSMAVYRLDSLTTPQATSIDRYLWLTADLKGVVEDPDYYFTATGPEAAAATDNLLLTQGWSRFRWEDVLAGAPQPFEYLPEPNGLVVRGQLRQAGTGKPRVGVVTYLASPSRITQLSNSLSNAQGVVQFETNQFNSLREVMLQTDPIQDSTSQLTVLDPFSARFSSAPRPSFGLSAGFQQDYARRHVQLQVQNVFSGKYRNLYAPERADSMAFFGKPTETYILDKFTRFKVMEEVLREYVPGVVVRIRKDGFHLLVVDVVNKTVLQENPLILLDGVPVFNVNKIMAMDPLKIQKLDVIDSRYLHGMAIYNGIVSFTTYKGDLEGFPLDAHVLVQRYEGVQRQREFYAPRYETAPEKASRLPDLRNLLYWNPEISLTATGGKAVEFYTGDQTGRYLVVVQGLAANGHSGSRSVVLEVKPAL